MKVAFSLVFLVSVARGAIYCPPDACDNAECENPGLQSWHCGSDRFEQNGGACGCCPTCITQLKVGDDCSALLLLGAVPTSECEGKLKCDLQSKKCAYLCNDELAASQSSSLLGRFIPRCETDGSYSPYQCQGSQCYCVAKDGTTIDGGYSVNRWEVAGMNCNCARAQHEYRKLNIVGRVFHCSSNGNYEKIQCHGSACFCADENGQQVLGSQAVHVTERGQLNCQTKM